MKANEFNEWITFHCTAFPSVRPWLNKAGAETLALWAETLHAIDLDAAKEATRTIHRGDASVKGWGDVPAVIRRLAQATEAKQGRGMIPRHRDQLQYTTDSRGHRVVVDRCKACRDSGLRYVWAKAAVEAMRQGELGPARTRPEEPTACECRAGREYSRRLATFDKRRFCEIHSGVMVEADVERLRAFVAEKQESDPFNLSMHSYPGAGTEAAS